MMLAKSIRTVTLAVGAAVIAVGADRWHSGPCDCPRDPLLHAMIQKESSGRADARHPTSGAVGLLQIRPIMVDDVNRIVREKRYTLDDRLDPSKSIEMWRIYSGHYTRDWNAEKVARRWYGGPDGDTEAETLGYWEDIKAAMRAARAEH